MNGEQLRAWRLAHNLNQADLAEALGISELTIARWEADQQTPPEYLGSLALPRLEQLLRAGTVMRSKRVRRA